MGNANITVNGGKLQMTDGGSWYGSFISEDSPIIYAGNVYVSADPRKIELADCVPWDGLTNLNTYDCVWIVEEKHTHSLTPVAAKAATCKAAGNKAYYTCECGKWFEDSAATKEIKDKNSVVIPKLTTHTYDNGTITTQPTCKAEGVKTYKCTVCGATKTESVPVVDHSYVSGTCEYCGEKEPVSIKAPVIKSSSVANTGKIKLTWAAVEGAAKYKVYRATSKTGKYSIMKTVEGTSYINSTAKAGTRYYYYVVAIDANGNVSEKSNIVNRVCDLPRTTVTLSNVASSGKIKVSWTKVDGAAKYQVQRATSKTGTYSVVKTTTSLSWTDTNTTAGKTYYYKVRAVHSNTNANSAYTAYKSRTCDLKRPTVSITRSSGKPKVSWTAVTGATKYKIYRSTSKTGTYSLVKTTTAKYWKDTTAKKGKTYYYKVVAVHKNSSANSAQSTVKSIKCTK